MEAAYAQAYRELYQRHWWWRAREAEILKVLRRIHPADGPGSVLDIGCGDGLFFDQLSQFGKVEGVEADASIVDPNGPHREQIHACPFDYRFQPGKRYGLIVMLDLLEHLDDPVGGLQHAVDLLEDDGRIVITVPAFRLLWTSHDDWNHHLTRYTKQSFGELARRTNLEIEQLRYFFHWTWPVKLAIRLKERLLGSAPRPAQVPAPLINRSVHTLCRVEQTLFRALPLPFGSSLLVVGRRKNSAPSNSPAHSSRVSSQ